MQATNDQLATCFRYESVLQVPISNNQRRSVCFLAVHSGIESNEVSLWTESFRVHITILVSAFCSAR